MGLLHHERGDEVLRIKISTTCIIALLHQCLERNSITGGSINLPGSFLGSAMPAMYSGNSHEPGQEMFIRMEKLSCCSRIPD